MTSEIVAQITVASYCQLNVSHLVIRSGAVPLAKGTARCVRVPGSPDCGPDHLVCAASRLFVAATCCKHFGDSRTTCHRPSMLGAQEEVKVPALEVLAYLQGVWRCTACEHGGRPATRFGRCTSSRSRPQIWSYACAFCSTHNALLRDAVHADDPRIYQYRRK